MAITVVDDSAFTDRQLNIPQPTDPQTAQLETVLDEATTAVDVLQRDRHDTSLSRLGSADEREDLLAPGPAQPWDY